MLTARAPNQRARADLFHQSTASTCCCCILLVVCGLCIPNASICTDFGHNNILTLNLYTHTHTHRSASSAASSTATAAAAAQWPNCSCGPQRPLSCQYARNSSSARRSRSSRCTTGSTSSGSGCSRTRASSRSGRSACATDFAKTRPPAQLATTRQQPRNAGTDAISQGKLNVDYKHTSDIKSHTSSTKDARARARPVALLDFCRAAHAERFGEFAPMCGCGMCAFAPINALMCSNSSGSSSIGEANEFELTRRARHRRANECFIVCKSVSSRARARETRVFAPHRRLWQLPARHLVVVATVHAAIRARSRSQCHFGPLIVAARVRNLRDLLGRFVRGADARALLLLTARAFSGEK